MAAFASPVGFGGLQRWSRQTRARSDLMGTRRHLASRRKSSAPQPLPLVVTVSDPSHDTWRVREAIPILRDGGLGVIPTDTSYAFVTDLNSKEGVQRLYAMKSAQGTKKPLSILCQDISTIQQFTYGIDRKIFKMMKRAFPGPYTFILPATHDVPRIVLEHKIHRKTWKRKEVGVRIPDDPYCQAVLSEYGGPLLCSSVPITKDVATVACDPSDICDTWCQEVDFVIDAQERESALSTVVDLTVSPPRVLRQGQGALDILGEYVLEDQPEQQA